MKIAIYGNEIEDHYIPVYQEIFDLLSDKDVELVLAEKVKKILEEEYAFVLKSCKTFCKNEKDNLIADILLSIGGDGTFLSAASYALHQQIPIAGINCGRLGFLADVSGDDLKAAMTQILNQAYTIEKRSLLRIVEPVGLFEDFNFALNELTVHKLDNSSMIKIETFINGEFLANYWADGLIVGTPTGSTAYSLSVGGPIVVPDLEGLIITPIAPHNLTVRPIIVPDDVEVELSVQGRGSQFLVSFDHRSQALNFNVKIRIGKAPLSLPVVKFENQSFYATLRNKLMWGADRRN